MMRNRITVDRKSALSVPVTASVPIIYGTREFRSSFQDSLTPAYNPLPLRGLAFGAESQHG